MVRVEEGNHTEKQNIKDKADSKSCKMKEYNKSSALRELCCRRGRGSRKAAQVEWWLPRYATCREMRDESLFAMKTFSQ
jgi:hypothetical protein